MPTLGIHASHEQLSPHDLLEVVRAAEAAGFPAAMCSDHLAPWSERQGESGHAWAWLGANEQPAPQVLTGGALVLGTLALNEAIGMRRSRA